MASLAGDDGDELYALTGGNPFYVSELLAAVRPPAAAVGRQRGAGPGGAARRRGAAARRARVGRADTGSSTGVLDAVMPDWATAAEQPERRQLLEVGPGT